MRDPWRVAVLDSGLADALAGDFKTAAAGTDTARVSLIAARRFVDDGRVVTTGPAVSDPAGHGTAVTRAICSMSSHPVALLIGQVLNAGRTATAASVAAAIEWAVEAQADLIHMSLGLREDRSVLAHAVAGAVRAGCVIIASAPARGGVTYPAGYAGVIRATGDARCAVGEISALDTAQAHFGGCPRCPGYPESGGASIGAANVAAIVIDRLEPGLDSESVCGHLRGIARYVGAERKATSRYPVRNRAGS